MSQRGLVLIRGYLFTIILCSHYKCEAKISNRKPLEGKVIGGSHTDILSFPHAVFLSIKCGETHMICGSSVVNQEILLTAAHCISNCYAVMKIEAHAGHENLKQITVVSKVSKTAVHGNYDSDTLSNDIALLLLSRPLPLGDRIKRGIIKRNRPESPTAFVAGWGVINDITRERPMILKMVQQVLQPSSVCSLIGRMESGMMCAGEPSDIEDRPSKGDSGSALISSDYQLIGLVSYRNEYYKGLLVYTNVSYYYNWIKKISKELYCSQKLYN